MPDFCAAFGCSNERNEKTKQQGITFHRFPNDKLRRNAWQAAVRRKQFEPTHRTVLCSFHFKPEDFDRTGQTVRIKEGVIPSIFKFPDRLSKLPRPKPTSQTSRTSNKAATEFPSPRSGTVQGLGELVLSEESVSLPSTARSSRTSKATEVPSPQSCTLVRGLRPIDLSEESISDHDYALDPATAKQKLAECQEEVEKLRRQLRNARDRERRLKKTVNLLLKNLKGKKISTKALLKNVDGTTVQVSCSSRVFSNALWSAVVLLQETQATSKHRMAPAVDMSSVVPTEDYNIASSPFQKVAGVVLDLTN